MQDIAELGPGVLDVPCTTTCIIRIMAPTYEEFKERHSTADCLVGEIPN